MLASEDSLLDYVIAFCDVIATIKAHACPYSRPVTVELDGRVFLTFRYQLRLATSSATDADQISSDAQLRWMRYDLVATWS